MSDSGQTTPRDNERKQSLVNKCLNERRRRDQENHYFEELAEIITASLTDMSSTFSVKPEKCAILQETVKQIKQIKQGNSGGGDSAVQQSQVSSSKPAILADDILGPLLLEALDGFLFVVNSQGKVEFVSENVTQFIKYSQDDLIGKSVYNIIHVGDHAQFSNNLLPMSVSSGIGGISWPSDNLGGKGRVFSCRLLVKPSCNDNDDLETKQTYVHQYESLQISSILHPSDTFIENAENNDTSSSLVCIARRLPLAEKTNTMLGVEQFTTKQDLNGKIIGCDISGIAPGRFSCPDFVGQNIQEFCHANDLQQLSKHLQEAVKNGSNTSGVYRFKMQESRYAFVQTKSKLFQNAINGSSEFIMSTHSIIRECDSDNELKGSASTSLMKSIIGPSLQQNLLKTQTPISNVNTSMANMALVGNNIMPGLNSGNLFGVKDSSSSDDFFNQLGWDANLSDSSVSSTGNSFMNSSYQSVANTSTSSFSNSWSSQVKLSQVQQQLQRSLSTSSQRSQVTNSNNMAAGTGNKRPSVLLGQLGQRSPSLDLGQMQSQSQIPPPQKSPSYAQSRHGGFQIPTQRGVMGYNRRSPAASPVPSIGQGNFNTPFSPRTPSPMLSPSPGMPTSGWGHQPMAGNAAQSGHQIFDEQSSYTHERLFQRLAGLENITGDKKVKRSGKLCQLLTQNSPPSSSRKSEPGTPKSGRSRHNSRQGYMEMSPADSIQSPQPGPGQSPPEKPQSTSNDDGEHVVHTDHKESNRLLKSLLSQEDDPEEGSVKEDNSSVKSEQTGEAQALQQKSVSMVEMEKNEAEAKKPNNILLKQLLSSDESTVLSETQDKPSIIHKLLDENKKDNCRSAPAESTSIDSDLVRQRHQSGPQEPQSTTTHSLPMPPLSSPLTSPVVQNFNQSQNSHVDTSLLKGLFSNSSASNMGSNQVSNINASAFPSMSGPIDNRASKAAASAAAAAGLSGEGVRDKNIDKLLHLLWEDNSNDGSRGTMRERIQSLKRKADMMESSDTEQNSALSAGLSSSQSSKLSKENALLTQLLSKKANNDIVVNTLSTIQPSGIPQQRIPQNLASKLLKVNPSSFISSNGGSEAKRARTDSGNNNQRSTLERALSAPKQDMNTISSTQSFDAMMEIGQNSNSGISNISEGSVSSQFNNQLSELHQILQSTISDTGNNSANITEVNLDDNTDPLLAQILQQAQDLQQDITLGTFPESNQNAKPETPGPVNNSAQSLSNHPTLNNNSYQKNNNMNSDILQQLEQALNDSNFNLDSLLGNSNVSSMDEQVAIDAIQKQLMMDMPGVSASNVQTPSLETGRVQARFNQNVPVPSQTSGSQIQQNVIGNQLSDRNQVAPGVFQNLGSIPQRIGAPNRPLQQLPGYNQATASGQNFPGQGPRLPPPQGALPSPTQQQRPMFSNSNPNSTAMQVRQSLLQQQKLKQMRERNKHVQQQQDRQKLLMQQQQQQQQQQRAQFSPQYSGQRGPQDNLSMGSNNVLPQFPENLAELMNSGTAPNVTLQRNQIPGPMSPRYQTIPGQSPQNPNMSSMMPPNPQLSPNFSQTQQQQQQQQQQWNVRQGPTSMAISPQGTAQYNNRHRSFSGGTLQTSPPQRFPLNDGQYAGNQQLGNIYSQQQQQQLYQQSRGGQLQRQLSRGGSPRASQSPFGLGPDPLLMSPHNVSPTSMRTPQQISPSYSQGGMGSGFGQGVMASQANSLPSPQYSQNQGSGQLGLNAHGMDIDISSLFDNSKKPLDVPLSVNTPGPPKTIKEELRNFCNARSQNSLQGQSTLQQSTLQSQSSLQNSLQGQSALQGQSSLQNSLQGQSALQGQSSLQNSLQGQSSLQNSLQGQSSLQNSLQGQNSLQNQNFMQNQASMQSHNSLQGHMMSGNQSHQSHQVQQTQQFMSPRQQSQQQAQHQLQQQQSMEQDTMSELPLDILEQINEMTQDHGITQPDFKEEVIVPKKREEAKSRYVKFQQLASSEDPDKKATNLFRKQLTSQAGNRSTTALADTSGTPLFTDPQSSVNVVQNEPRTPIEEIKPANQKDSLLQQLLSD